MAYDCVPTLVQVGAAAVPVLMLKTLAACDIVEVMNTSFVCANCGVTVTRRPSAVVGRVFCSRQCCAAAEKGKKSLRRPMIGPDHPRWKGGRVVRKSGYVIVWMPEHPNADRRGYVLEHRLMMAEKLGRALSPSEHVHHVNGDRSDNQPENLELLGASEHCRLHRDQDGPVVYVRGWVKLGHGCVDCGTTAEPHSSKGLCRRCYGRIQKRKYDAKQKAIKSGCQP
jgi:hypothetical protein